MVPLTIRLFGRFEVRYGDQPSDTLNARRARELFCYLVLHRNHPHRREKLVDLLWEDAPHEQARKYLRQALWQIQTALRPHTESRGAPALAVDTEWIQLNGCDQLNVDVIRFEDATRSCQGIPGSKLNDVERQSLEEAVSLYCGDLLEGWCQDWCLFERERLQNDFLDVLEKLICFFEARCDSERGLAYARHMLAIDPARENVYRHVMRLHLLAGNPTQALREFQRCERMLMQELAVKPSQLTRSLYESIREGRVDGPRPELNLVGVTSSAPDFSHDQLLGLVSLIKQLQQLFAGIESRLDRDITTSDVPRDEPR